MVRLLLLVTLFLPAGLFAADFRVADIHYKERHFKTYDQIKDLRGKYEKIISQNNLTSQELIYAVSQVAKIDLLLTDYLPELVEVSTDSRKQESEHCLSIIEKIKTISPENYVRFGMRCLHSRYVESSYIDFLNMNGRISDIYSKYRYLKPKGIDGGDIWRGIAQLRMHRRLIANGIFFDIDDAWKNLSLVEKAEASLVVPLSQKYSGRDFSETYFFRGKFNLNFGIKNNNKGKIQEAVVVWKSQISELEFLEEIGDPKFNERMLENRAIKARMSRYVKVVEPCIKKTDWYSCIYDSELQ